MFSLADLATLVAVADHGSVRAAASALGRTQPAITQAVRRLEDEAGFELLDRSSYRARATERGQSFINHARQTLWQARRLQSFSALLATGIEPRLRIEVDSAIPPKNWTCLVDDVPETFPETVVEIECGEGTSTLRRLATGEADMALLFDFAVGAYGVALESVPAGTVAFCNAVRSDKAHLLGDDGFLLPQVLVSDFAEGGPEYGAVAGKQFWRVSNHRMQSEAILAGLGWGTTPRFMVREALACGELSTRACFGLAEHSPYPISLYRRRGEGAVGKVAQHIWNRCTAARPPVDLPVRYSD